MQFLLDRGIGASGFWHRLRHSEPVLKSDQKFAEIKVKSIPLTHNDCSLSWLGTVTSIKKIFTQQILPFYLEVG